jgi:hypothetical protein
MYEYPSGGSKNDPNMTSKANFIAKNFRQTSSKKY